ncbi:MAG: hypothetical protein M1822_010024 [Bathelium mastoideum]|nr:MAG: hypothetical protein M1822_010024 [Bathelium mastoideum]
MSNGGGSPSSETHFGTEKVSSGSKELTLTTENERLRESPGRDDPDKTSAESSFVEWDGPEDPYNPINWPIIRKIPAVLGICSLAFVSSFASSIFAPAAIQIAEEFHISETVANLGVSLYVLGFAAGPLLWGPLSEAYGRMTPLCAAFLGFTIFQIPVGVAHNAATILVSRLICGIAGSAAFAIPPAMAVDFLTPAQRLFCINFYMTFTFVGPVAGPIAGTYLTVNYGWRWTAWTCLILGGATGLAAALAIPESCAEILLQRKAAKLRKQSGDARFISQRDAQPVTAHVLLTKYLARPSLMLVKEPILLIMTIYSSFIYGILYLLFFSLPWTFTTIRHWSAKSASLSFLAILVGVFLACFGTAYSDTTWWLKRFLARGRQFLPEDRLPQVMISAILMPAGLFWFAWTSSASVPWPAQVVALVLVGIGVVLNMLSTTTYLIDVYQLYSNSAIAAYVCIRSGTAFAFPLFAEQMFERLGAAWAASVLAFICVALAPAPFLFWRFGKKIRGWSRYSF